MKATHKEGESVTTSNEEEAPTIFVSIPSYRDPECQWTVKDLFEKAERPERVFVGICWQTNPSEDQACFQEPYPRPAQVREHFLDWKAATGPCLARHFAQGLYRGEDYYLSIDSHTRFVPRWDSRLLELLRQCSLSSSKPILTGYPAGYQLPNKLPSEEERRRPPFLCVKGFGKEDGMLRLHGRLLSGGFAKPLPCLFWVSGFSFSSAQMLKEVPYDPHLPFVFFGEESSMSVRLWTHGWDFFAPGEHVLFHLWSRHYRPTFWELPQKSELRARSQRRIRHLLGMTAPRQTKKEEGEERGKEPKRNEQEQVEATTEHEEEDHLVELNKYGLGHYQERDLEAFQRHTGVNFREGRVEERARWGGLDKMMFVDGVLETVMGMAGIPFSPSATFDPEAEDTSAPYPSSSSSSCSSSSSSSSSSSPSSSSFSS
ncbi:Glucose N-acetyltransferase 1 [Balamuthia mandrillaris]